VFDAFVGIVDDGGFSRRALVGLSIEDYVLAHDLGYFGISHPGQKFCPCQ
jgi:hypothetical protein